MGDSIYTFDSGIPGFEQLQQFTMTEVEGDFPIRLMHAVEDENISFMIVSPFFFYPDYEWDLPETVAQELALSNEDDVEVWSIITVREEAEQSTINLLAPIVLNKKSKCGKQYIIPDRTFSSRAPLYRD